ncbi:nucleotidyltransferase family protein [Pseudoalteromonas denitrificans]|uniref:Molybdenum cofactor cytidylyltransferase n=1 Tax=Pseudoalteromonas denitrificans DSM 6059 TaxID=1123010 RepID=A0A1I1FHC2_9GAMM|nr:nucleotidyltransferase family protein [Pseudoalteromonas denitrificans]SFB96533.1 molybdenum cofactor cytidylyltransferase [Pseudoalteromonas denitrificans DSM 6059]
MSFDVVILAAGKSTRFNGIKQLAEIEDTNMINFCINKFSQIDIDDIYVALGANSEKILPSLSLNCTPIMSENWHLGLGHTISDIIKKLSIKSNHLLLCLGDQVLIPQAHYQKLINESHTNRQKIIATLSQNKMMAPAIFPKSYFRELEKLFGDKGAGCLMRENAHNVICIECNHAKLDIDTQEEYFILKQKLKNNQMEQV